MTACCGLIPVNFRVRIAWPSPPFSYMNAQSFGQQHVSGHAVHVPGIPGRERQKNDRCSPSASQGPDFRTWEAPESSRSRLLGSRSLLTGQSALPELKCLETRLGDFASTDLLQRGHTAVRILVDHSRSRLERLSSKRQVPTRS